MEVLLQFRGCLHHRALSFILRNQFFLGRDRQHPDVAFIGKAKRREKKKDDVITFA